MKLSSAPHQLYTPFDPYIFLLLHIQHLMRECTQYSTSVWPRILSTLIFFLKLWILCTFNISFSHFVTLYIFFLFVSFIPQPPDSLNCLILHSHFKQRRHDFLTLENMVKYSSSNSLTRWYDHKNLVRFHLRICFRVFFYNNVNLIVARFVYFGKFRFMSWKLHLSM